MKTLQIALAALALAAAHGSAEEETELERVQAHIDLFRLWNDCKPTTLDVFKLPDNIDLTVKDIEVAVRSRLRIAGLHTDSIQDAADSFLRVSITIYGNVGIIEANYFRPVRELASGAIWPVSTWSIHRPFATGVSAYVILSALSQQADEFIDEYLRVNEEACAPADGG